jgi:hypothetical protein
MDPWTSPSIPYTITVLPTAAPQEKQLPSTPTKVWVEPLSIPYPVGPRKVWVEPPDVPLVMTIDWQNTIVDKINEILTVSGESPTKKWVTVGR